MATIEDVNSRTLLQQFHNLYEKQNKTETNVQNLDAKIDKETNDRQTADLSINTEIQTLKDQIDSLGVLFTYKGEVATIQDLPATNNKPGDVYYVDSEQSEYVWLEKSGVYQWEEFGPAIDLSEYAKQEDLGQLENAVNAMNTKVESNTSNIVSLTNTKQNKLTAGTNITIDENNVISASGGEKLYDHTLKITISNSNEIYVKIISKSQITFGITKLNQYIYEHGKYLPISFIEKIDENTLRYYQTLYQTEQPSSTSLDIHCSFYDYKFTTDGNNVSINSTYNIVLFSIITDTVTEL